MLRSEKMFESGIMTKIKGLKMHFHTEKGRLGALLNRRRNELRHVRAQVLMLNKKMRETDRTKNMAKKFEKGGKG